MKKFVITATALLFALGLTVSAQAQSVAEKSKSTTAQVQKATVPDTAPEAAKTEATKAAPAEPKKLEPAATGKKHLGSKGKKCKETAGSDNSTAKELKTTTVPGTKSGPETKVDKQ